VSDELLTAPAAWTLARSLDADRIEAAWGAFRALARHDQPPRPTSWRGALLALDSFADALATVEAAHVDYDLVVLLVPHLALADLAPAVREHGMGVLS